MSFISNEARRFTIALKSLQEKLSQLKKSTYGNQSKRRRVSPTPSFQQQRSFAEATLIAAMKRLTKEPSLEILLMQLSKDQHMKEEVEEQKQLRPREIPTITQADATVAAVASVTAMQMKSRLQTPYVRFQKSAERSINSRSNMLVNEHDLILLQNLALNEQGTQQQSIRNPYAMTPGTVEQHLDLQQTRVFSKYIPKRQVLVSRVSFDAQEKF